MSRDALDNGRVVDDATRRSRPVQRRQASTLKPTAPPYMFGMEAGP